MGNPKVIYISGPITGVAEYWKPFEQAEEQLTGMGYTVLTPSRLPSGMSKAQYMRIDMAMIDSADAVLFLPGWSNSHGCLTERAYCLYTDKPTVHIRHFEPTFWDVIRGQLKEVLGE